MRTLFTSESVTEGHPDKVCDQISDAVLDALLARDPMARVACETCATTGLVQVMGEITTTAYVAIDEIARQVLRDIGYVDASLGFSADSCAVLTAVHAQSPDIAMGVDHALETREAGESSTASPGCAFCAQISTASFRSSARMQFSNPSLLAAFWIFSLVCPIKTRYRTLPSKD